MALAGGQGPDIVLTNGPSWTQRFVTGNKLLDLNAFAQKFGWKEKLAPIVIQLGSYDGKLIALPKTIETQALFYNQTLFKQNSWTPPKNLAEAETLADTMLKAGIQPFAAGNAGQRFANRHLLGIFYNNYCSPDMVYKALTGEMPWNAPVFVEAVELLKSWWDKGCFGGQKYFSLNMNQSFAILATGRPAWRCRAPGPSSGCPTRSRRPSRRWAWRRCPSSRTRRPIRSSCSASAPISRSTPPRRSPRAAPWCSTG